VQYGIVVSLEVVAGRRRCLVGEKSRGLPLSAGAVLEPHYHNNFEWFYVLRGEGTMIIEDEEQDVAPGSLITIGPNLVHSLKPHGDQPIHCFCFGLNLSKDGSAYFEPETTTA
jgi:quercetin dioxygenase-like cupin family protein